ncbi:conserved membrane protein of unknown function [Candidatus Filomicrobium marinum]|uniref:DUF1468 domain-containing protein n=2 Tax=Filomicrobium TaxID=119044 RepID=A0A0D6JIZ2_9HYPH|nr:MULTISPECIES: tripartite tricarboxylate transporter TctB family protein [Filomicrobium]MCV0370894.1 tripartite tricarboxylate transporter TctB family protein [Filomicrobium sp.]CFX32864.1 conserved membrane protein of unknown function [Candidatus Filomicrobium marinum]CPR21949.1 conserved membrane protein of unknown function [Candidatus Filomicrobium marinum]SDP47987.1 putative tricarboxylic transport membrane protein [Filomicrobium insigne]
MTSSKRLIRTAFPLSMLLACAFLWTHIASNPAMLNVPNAVGPGGWPKAMLAGLAFFSLLAFLVELNNWRISARDGNDTTQNGEKANNGSAVMAIAGVGVILIYGFAIPYLGFALATFLFIVTWCLMGQIRSPITISLVSIIGTIVLLYMFVALAKMPLNRGVEPFNQWTISLYRVLRIY